MKSIGISESYQNGNLKIIIYFARFLGSTTDFLSVKKKEQILSFLDTRIKDTEIDPEKRWTHTRKIAFRLRFTQYHRFALLLGKEIVLIG